MAHVNKVGGAGSEVSGTLKNQTSRAAELQPRGLGELFVNRYVKLTVASDAFPFIVLFIRVFPP